jgi:hypothetical protein
MSTLGCHTRTGRPRDRDVPLLAAGSAGELLSKKAASAGDSCGMDAAALDHVACEDK